MTDLHVLVTGPAKPYMDEIRAAAPGADCRYLSGQEEIDSLIESADVVAGNVSPAALGRARRLRWVHSWAAGPEHNLYPEMVASSVVLTSSKGNGAIPLAEQAMMLMLMLNRQAMRWVRGQEEHRWDRFTHAELNGLTCGIIGLGHSGQDLALKAKAFHMRVVGVRHTAQATPNVDHLYTREQLSDLLRESDFVVMTAPMTPETKGMLGEAEFRAMKPTAYYICFSRGGIADDSALLRALHEGWIAGAGLDAHTHEPLPPDSPFWQAPNTIITPHNGATTEKTFRRGVEIFTDNLKRFVNEIPLENVVDKELGY